MVDVDGDKSLVIADGTLIKVAERNINKFDIVPLYYNMKKAEATQLTNQSIYDGLNAAFTGSNIGQYSNNISKIWNSEVFISGTEEEKIQAINVIKLLCMENNFCIDEAKTLYMPERPKFVKGLVTSFTKELLPHFFRYAKDKENHQVSAVNDSFVNKLNKIIQNPRINCRSLGLGKIDYKLLMSNPDIEFNVNFTERGRLIKEDTNPLIVKYCELNKKYGLIFDAVAQRIENAFSAEILMKSQIRQDLEYKKLSQEIKHELSQYGYTDMEVSDMLVKFTYGIKQSRHKMVLWLCYGDCILSNLEKNFSLKTKAIQCVDCGEWFEVSKKDTKACRCNVCQKEYRTNYQKELMRRKRSLLAQQNN